MGCVHKHTSLWLSWLRRVETSPKWDFVQKGSIMELLKGLSQTDWLGRQSSDLKGSALS